MERESPCPSLGAGWLGLGDVISAKHFSIYRCRKSYVHAITQSGKRKTLHKTTTSSDNGEKPQREKVFRSYVAVFIILLANIPLRNIVLARAVYLYTGNSFECSQNLP